MIHGVCSECANKIRWGCLGVVSLSHKSNWNFTRIGLPLWAVEQAPWRLRFGIKPHTHREGEGGGGGFGMWDYVGVSENRAPLNPTVSGHVYHQFCLLHGHLMAILVSPIVRQAARPTSFQNFHNIHMPGKEALETVHRSTPCDAHPP